MRFVKESLCVRWMQIYHTCVVRSFIRSVCAQLYNTIRESIRVIVAYISLDICTLSRENVRSRRFTFLRSANADTLCTICFSYRDSFLSDKAPLWYSRLRKTLEKYFYFLHGETISKTEDIYCFALVPSVTLIYWLTLKIRRFHLVHIKSLIFF